MVSHRKPRQEHEFGHAGHGIEGLQVGFDPAAIQVGLHYANTLEGRHAAQPRETLDSYAALVTWCQRRGLLTEPEAQRLSQQAARRPAQAAVSLTRAIALREALYQIFAVLAKRKAPRPADLATFNATLAESLAFLRIAAGADGFIWAWGAGEDAFDRVFWPIALAAANLLTSPQATMVRECAAPTCRWLFLDTTRNRSRRWCDMKVCGNRAKARRHYARKKRAATDTAADAS